MFCHLQILPGPILGDNRANSEDSRNADVGNVKREYIYGKAWFVISPRKDFGLIK